MFARVSVIMRLHTYMFIHMCLRASMCVYMCICLFVIVYSCMYAYDMSVLECIPVFFIYNLYECEVFFVIRDNLFLTLRRLLT